MNAERTVVVLSSPYGPIALTIDQLHSARARGSELGADVRAADIVRDDASGAERPCLVDAREVARLFGIAPTWLLQRARERRIPHYRAGKHVRFDPDEVREFLAEMPDRPADSIETSLL